MGLRLKMWFKQLQGILVIGCFVLTMDSVMALELDVQERAWLDAHPVIRVAPDPDFAPFESFSAEGKYQGMAADYLRLVEKKLGIRFEIVRLDSWSDVLENARRREVDVLPATARSPQRETFLSFTRPHIVVPGVVVSSHSYRKLDELLGEDKKVAVVTDYVWEDLLEHRKVDVRLIRVEDTRTGLELASMGAVDAMVTDLASATNVIQQSGISNLRIVERRLEQNLELGIAVRSDWPELQRILDKALASISKEEQDTIKTKWLSFESPFLLDKPEFWYSVVAVCAVLLLIVVWNRTLRHQVNVRTEELKNAQRQLIQAEKMESIGRLAAGVAHEVKNPLAIIQMGADFLKQEVGQQEVVGDVLHDMEDAVERADSVIKGLLDFSRDKKLEMAEGDLNEVIERALHLVGHELRQRHIELRQELAADLSSIKLDKNKLQQVFINLFMNAAHAMHKDGELIVSSKVTQLADKTLLLRDSNKQFHLGQRVIQVEVADTGPGIDAADLKKLFDPFFTTKPVGEGTGLGLSVSRNIIQLHHGLIDLRNRDAAGAVVIMVFPFNEGDKK